MASILRIISLSFAAGIVLLAGCTNPPTNLRPPGVKRASPPPVKVDVRKASRSEVGIYVPKMVGTELRIASIEVAAPIRADKYAALNALLNYNFDGHRIFPSGTRVVSFSVDSAGTGTLILSKEIRNYRGGSVEESAALNSLVLTAIEHSPHTRQVQIQAEDGELETLGGGADLTIPAQPDRTMIVSAK